MFARIACRLRRPRRLFHLLQIEPSLECNLDCVMCPWSEMRPGQAVMAPETFARIEPCLVLAQEVDLTGGGEPLTNSRLAVMARSAKAAGCRTGFSTNGALLTPELAEEFVAMGLDWISFSVDAARPETYERIRQRADFATLDRNIMGLAEVKVRRRSPWPQVVLVFVMMQENYTELPEYVDLARHWGAGQVIVKNLDVIVKEGDDRRRVFKDDGDADPAVEQALTEAARRAGWYGIPLRRYGLQPAELAVCEPDPVHNLFVNWQGGVSPCITLAYAGSRVFGGQRQAAGCLCFGNVMQAALPGIWESADYRAFRQHYRARAAWQGQSAVDAMLAGTEEDAVGTIPPAPEPCRTCYYLYGV